MSTAVIPLTIPREEMQRVFGPAVEELMAALSAQDIALAGPLFAHHLKIVPDTFDFELGVPVSEPVTSAGRVRPGERPAMKVAQTVYHGPYEGLPGAWGEFMEWVEAQGHTPAPDVWEVYVVGPDASSDPSDWQTELNRPIVE